LAADRYDVVVVGGGPAGCVLAARLSEEEGRSVCLVEAGPDYGPLADGRWPAELLDATGIPDSHDWRDGECSLPWARVIGGCSAHNACFIGVGSPADHEWGDGWTYDGIRPYLERARKEMRAHQVGREELGAWHAGFLEAATAAGTPAVDDLSDPASPVGVGRVTTNALGGTRWNAAFAYLDPARERPNLTVISEAAGERVLIAGGRVGGLAIRKGGGRRELHAPLVVVTCGAYGSSALLLRSGIGPSGHLKERGIAVVADLAGVGTGLIDHARLGFGFSLRDGVLQSIVGEPVEKRVAGQVLLKARSTLAQDEAADLHLFSIVRPLPEGGHQARITVGLIGARSRGRVRLRSTEPDALPEVESAHLEEEDDLSAILEGMAMARAIAATEPLASAIASEDEPGADADLAVHARTNVGSYYHPVATCPIGEVVDERGAVHGIEGLHVADASIIPRSPHVSPHLTVLAVAERMAELLA
jgi:choline dehydrogenase